MNQYEISKLKKQLLRKNEVIQQMKDDLAYVQNQLATVQAERDKYHGQLQIARHTMQNVDQIIDLKVKDMKNKLQLQNAASLNQLQILRNRVNEEQTINQKFNQQIRNKDAVISQLSLRLKEMAIKHKDNSIQLNIKEISDQATISYNQFYKLTQKYNKLSENMENILAENKILRKLQGVPQNFGFDLEQIKIAEKQQLEDYKAQCRKLETQIEQLEAERTQLRYRLRQYNTLYSNKGDRYKDLTQRQLDLLDMYALNLKQGKDQIPQIDKSQKQMEKQIIRLRAQIEILQSKTPIQMFPGNTTKTESANNEMSKDSLKKLQDQIKGILQPFVQDIKKLSQNNLNSIIQNVQLIQGDNNLNIKTSNAAILPTSGLRPPIPLPNINNDWSTIKQGYSYRYACKIPIDLSDLESDQSYIIRAKYQIAALQLQNIESLKMLKQKQDQQKLIKSQLSDLKQKLKKCLLVQDDLFIKYFKSRDQLKQNVKETQIEKRKLTNQRDQLRTELASLKQAYHSLVTKTQIQAKFKDFGQRLAKSQAGLLKNQRKYQILFQEHKFLRESYTKMELKAAKNQANLKIKCNNIRRNQKQLTFLMNQILQQAKDSVSSDTHKLLLSKMQLLNDRCAQFAFKQAELRLKISRLQSIQRQMNIKDDIIQNIRQDKLDLLLQLEVVRNRLKSIDPNYKKTLDILNNLVGFINKNTISLIQYFKKFDKNKSGQLNKVQFKSALDAFGFKLNNQQFELLYSQFDLDGSGQITYAQFIRKLRRGGAVSRSQDQQAIYLFFKSIKSANITIKRAFDIIDKDGSGQISKSQMQTAFKQIGIQCDSKTLDAIFRYADTDMNDSISCQQLQKLYYDIVRETEMDWYQIKATLDWKYKFVLKIQQAAIKNKMTLEETFKALDNDGNSYMTISELQSFLNKLGVILENKYLKELFKFLDTRFDGRIQYNEFLRILDDAKKQNKRVQRLQAVRKRAEQLKKQNQGLINQLKSSKPSQQAIIKIRMQALQTKQLNLIKRNEKLCKSLALKQQQIRDHQGSTKQNQKQLNILQDKYSKQRQQSILLKQQMKGYIGQAQAKKLKQQNLKIEILNKQLQLQLETFKGLCSAITDKNKGELMSVQKIKAQLNKHYDIVKQLQSQNINKSDLGRLALQIQYSKRNQQIVNKKYEDVCNQIESLTKFNSQLSKQSLDKQNQIANIHLSMIQKLNLKQKQIDSLTAKILPTISATKIDQFMVKLRQISSHKSQLEQQNKALRQKNFNLQLKYDRIQIQRDNIIQLQKKLRKTYTDENSVALIDLTKKLSQYKIGEIKAKREYNLLKQKEQYYMRINNSNAQNIKELEAQLSKWQGKFNQRQEFWRKRMADQMKLREELQRQVQKTKQNQQKARKYFNQKQIQQIKIQEKYQQLGQERQRKLSQFAKPSNMYKQSAKNNQKIEELNERIEDFTLQLQQKEKQNYRLKMTLQQLVPQQKLRFSSIGSQIGNHIQTNSFILQTDLTTSQLKNNARRFLNTQRQQQNFFREQAQRMAQAAQQSIDTLQKIIDDKNEQIRRKQKIIDNLKRQMIRSKDEDCAEIQKLNEQLRELRTKKQIASIDQIMNKSTHKQFYPSSNNDEKIKSLVEMIQQKDIQVKNWQKKYNQLFISKNKAKPTQNPNNKIIQNKLKQLMEQRENQKKKYIQAQKKMAEKVKNLEKLIKQKDTKLANLNKTITQLKDQIINQKQQLSHQKLNQNDEFIKGMIKGNVANDGKMQMVLQRNIEQLQAVKKKNKQYQAEIKKMREQSKLNKTMSRGR